MDYAVSGESPAILHLHRWNPSEFQLNLADFREAFISPTRELLLLLSRQSEALLLPLVRGTSHCENLQSQSREDACSQSSREPSMLELKDELPCSSASALDCDNGLSHELEFSRFHGYPFISDVCSIAWGVCGDTYNEHGDSLFRELLFVCGSRGVTVHAFREPNKTTHSTSNVEFEKGKWVDWGPSSTSDHKANGHEFCLDDTGTCLSVNKNNGNREFPEDMCKETEFNESSGGADSKRWLQSFYTKAETIISDGSIRTRFPENSSFPCSAKIVSFSILEVDLPFLDFLPPVNSLPSTDESHPETDRAVNKSDSFSSSGFGSYKCSRVFSSHSNYLVGFYFTLVDSVSFDNVDERKSNRIKNVLLVARVDNWGIQWVSAVKLAEKENLNPLIEWTDFCFSDNLLVCLNSSGFIYFYSAMSGERVVHLDILQACGLNPHPRIWRQGKSFVNSEMQIKQSDIVHDDSISECGDFLKRRMFRKLLCASKTSLLAAVDEYGVTYVINAAGYLPDTYYSNDKLFQHFQHLGFGMLFGWKVGGSDVGHQRVHYDGNDTILSSQLGIHHGKGTEVDLSLSGFSATKKLAADACGASEAHSQLMRNVFLPIEKFSEDDVICFSSLGITRLIKKKNIKNQKSSSIAHFNLHADSEVLDDRCINSAVKMFYRQCKEETSVGEAIGCNFHGFLYLVTKVGLSVVLPSVSVSSNFLPVETIGYRQHGVGRTLEVHELKQMFAAWKVEILDRILVHEGPEEADRLCLENGWDLRISRLRRLQLALDYLRYDEIEQSLEMLVGVNLAEEGILRVVLAAVYLMFCTKGNDSEVSASSRLLALASCFTTTMIRKCGLLKHKKGTSRLQGSRRALLLSLPPVLLDEVKNEMQETKRLHEMSHFLEIIRGLQYELSPKFKKQGQGSVDGEEALILDSDLSQDEPQLALPSYDALPSDTVNQQGILNSAPSTGSTHALMSKDSLDSRSPLDVEALNEATDLVPQNGNFGKRVFPLENPKEMIARWKLNNLDLKTVVKDALHSGRLPLAVLQLHLHRSVDLDNDKETLDTFTEVRDIGRAIAYDLFLEGEIGLAVATLQRLGEDVEIFLKQLLFGTVRRTLRSQVAEEMRKYSYLGPYEWKILQKISLVERLYPSSSFWRTFLGRQKELMRPILNSPGAIKLELPHSHLFGNLTIECGEIDGVVLGSWQSVNENSPEPAVDEDTAHAGYWAGAAVWASAWDQRTFDRIVLDQPFLMGVHVLWESQVEYYLCHNNWEEVIKLLDLIPPSVLFNGNLQVALDGPQHTPPVGYSSEISEYRNYICSIEELDAVCMDVPGIKLLRLPVNLVCSAWLQVLMEQELAKKFIFLKEYWENPSEIVALLARSGFITSRSNELPIEDNSSSSLNLSDRGRCSADTVQALHQLFVHQCVQYNLPNFLDVYLDHQTLALDDNSLRSLLEAAGECHWAKWLLLSRIKGHEYEASFYNARSIMSRNRIPDSNLSVLEGDEIVHTVDDIAEGGGEMAALATLMYAPEPIQNCLSKGGVNRHGRSSAQCTLENLKPTLQHFPTIWRTLVAASLGQEVALNFVSKTNNELSDYLNWRDNIFLSSARDTSLLQMLPCWFPKAVRRLIQLYIQGPLGWQSLAGVPTGDSLLHRNVEFYIHAEDQTAIGSVSWEATIQKHVQEELYDSSLEENGLGLEHHLNRGRALAAFNHVLGVRVQKFKLEGQSDSSGHGQTNFQSDVQTLLAPLTPSEEALLSSVIPLAIIHFEDSVLVASCAFLLELWGLSASMLRVDVAALRRILSFYKNSKNEKYNHFARMGSAFHPVPHEGYMVESLARTLADEYLHKDISSENKLQGASISLMGKQPSRALMLVLQHLEKASLSLVMDGNICGSWLLTGQGDGAELRSQQKAASEHWNLVSVFCQMHQLPPSTKYLAFLARDNDWVGFFTEAHIGGYPFETVVQVASKEFSDPRLKIHILTVLKSMQSRRKAVSSASADNTEKRSETSYLEENMLVPAELFKILADCEKQKNPGETLLRKAKEMSWSILAMIASCFPDVSPLDCLTVWLEITAARETSSIKVNDIASQIADNVGAAVEATNSLPAGARDIAFHYNRQNPKRRRLIDTISLDPSAEASDVSSTAPAKRHLVQDGFAEDERKVGENINNLCDSDEGPVSLSKMVAVLCEQQLFLPLLRAFEIFLPSCSLLPFIRSLQAFSQMRLSEASAHLGSFSARIKDEPSNLTPTIGREGKIGVSWMSSTAVKAANAMLSTSPSPYEKRCLLQLLAATDFGDGGSAVTYYRRLYWKINIAEPLLRKDDSMHLGNETLDDDAALLSVLEKNGYWEQARNWAKQLEASGGPWKSAVHHVTETQAESMVAEWKEFLWDVPEERVALWDHCQRLFIRYAFPPLQAGLFFLRHAENVEKDLPVKELHDLLLLSLQWLSGMITVCSPVYPMHLLRELETRVWLVAVESEAHIKSDGDFTSTAASWDPVIGYSSSIVEKTASIITKMDSHINAMRIRTVEKDTRENNIANNKNQALDASTSAAGGNTKMKRRTKGYMPSRRPLVDPTEKTTDLEDGASPFVLKNDLQDENLKIEISFSKWEERVGPAELESAVLSLLEFGQITAAKQLQNKLSPTHVPPEFTLVNAALKLAALSTPSRKMSLSVLDEEVCSVVQSYNLPSERNLVDPLQALESLASMFRDGNGCGLCKRIIAVVKAANVLGLSFSEAFEKQPVELLQLLSLKAQESFEEAHLLVQTHSLPPAGIAQILTESFLKGLLAAHRGGYMDSQKEEGPAPLLWRFSDFLKWAELCPSEPEIGHALMRLVITGQEIPHDCEVELLILSHHFYKSSACLDGVDVLVALAATRVEAYVSEGDFSCLARLITGVGNFHALNFILGILIENGQLDLLLQKYSAAADANTGTAEAVRGFRMAVLTSLKQFNPKDLDAFALVYNHFDMKHETAALLESRALQSSEQWFRRYDKDQNEDLLESMRYFIEAAEAHSSIDAGNKTRKACAQASLVSLQIRMPDSRWLNLSETNARRLLVEQSRFQEALIVAEAYGLNQASEWALVLWNQMLKPELTEEFVAEFVAVLPLQPSMLVELARFYRAEVAARVDQSQFSVWLTGGGLPAEWAKYLERSFRCLLKRTRDLRLRLQLATIATGFTDIIDTCGEALDKVPENAGPLVLRKGHGGAYLPLM